MEFKAPVLTKASMENNIDTKEIEREVVIKSAELRNIPIISKAFDMLDKLPDYLRYHTKDHTEDVFHEAIMFGLLDSVKEKDLEMIAVSAVWHDTGFLIRKDDNEIEAVKLFKEEAIDSNINYVDDVEKMILDTKLMLTKDGPEAIASHPLSSYLLDADVSNLGRTDFREKLNLMAEELKINMQDHTDRLKFLKFTLSLLKNKIWYTDAARRLRQKQQLLNIEELEKEIEELEKVK
ncbi:MAG: hypothetical protein KGI58_03090 [Patescibacteria group bacterium]|nr:hypothetical protein [Patescibacteria group bacterium]